MAEEQAVQEQGHPPSSLEAMVETKVAEAVAGLPESVPALRDDLVKEVRFALDKLHTDMQAEVAKAMAAVKEDVLGDATKLLETAGKLIGELTPQMDIHSRIQTLEDDLNKLGIKVRYNLG